MEVSIHFLNDIDYDDDSLNIDNLHFFQTFSSSFYRMIVFSLFYEVYIIFFKRWHYDHDDLNINNLSGFILISDIFIQFQENYSLTRVPCMFLEQTFFKYLWLLINVKIPTRLWDTLTFQSPRYVIQYDNNLLWYLSECNDKVQSPYYIVFALNQLTLLDGRKNK